MVLVTLVLAHESTCYKLHIVHRTLIKVPVQSWHMNLLQYLKPVLQTTVSRDHWLTRRCACAERGYSSRCVIHSQSRPHAPRCLVV